MAFCNRPIRNNNFYRYVGSSDDKFDCTKLLFSEENLRRMSVKITQLLEGVEPTGRPIVVPLESIANVLSNVWDNYIPPTGDIYSRYTIPSGEQTNAVVGMMDQAIEIITSQIKSDYQIRDTNSKLTVWTTVLGDFNEQGLRAYAPIKIQEKRPNPMEFNMNY